MKHLKNLNEDTLKELKVGEYFTYRYRGFTHHGYKKGVKVTAHYMIPVGLMCESIEAAQKQN